MAMTQCRECTHPVSSLASSCPHCGCPVSSAAEAAAIGTQSTTIQQTSKRLKMHTILALLMIITGLLMVMQSPSTPENNQGIFGFSPSLPALTVFSGIIWYIVTRCRIWWHHK